MLSQISISAAYPVANVLTKRGLVLTPKAGSELEALVSTCQVDNVEMPEDAVLIDSSVEAFPSAADVLFAQASTESFDGVCDHDQVMDLAVDLLARKVEFTMHLARNVVAPQISEICAAVDAVREKTQNGQIVPLAVTPSFAEPLYESPDFLEMLKDYEHQSYREVAPMQLTHAWGERTPGSALATGLPGLDELASRLFSKKEARVQD